MTKQPDYRLTLRFKPDEHAAVKAKAGDKPLSTYVRELVLEKAASLRKGIKSAPVKDHKVLAQILALLGQHRLVRAYKTAEQNFKNGVELADDETKALLLECRDLLAKIHKLLMHALGVAEK